MSRYKVGDRVVPRRGQRIAGHVIIIEDVLEGTSLGTIYKGHMISQICKTTILEQHVEGPAPEARTRTTEGQHDRRPARTRTLVRRALHPPDL